jgi:hypothetical protein
MAATARVPPTALALSIALNWSLAPATAHGQAANHAAVQAPDEDAIHEPASPMDGVPAAVPATPASSAPTGPPGVTSRQRPDFLFGRPGLTLGVRAGFSSPRARSDVFDFITSELTLDRGDFNALSLAAEADIWLGPRLDAVLGIGYSSASADSEYREWEDDETGLPITQRSSLRQVPVTAGLKYYLTSRGESLGRFAWIPARSAFYVGAGGGFLRHSFRQVGEFVVFDEDGAWIEEGSPRSSGWSPTGHIFGGVDYSLGPRTVISAEARQSWSSSDLGRDFEGFEIDLSGFQLMMGIRWRL